MIRQKGRESSDVPRLSSFLLYSWFVTRLVRLVQCSNCRNLKFLIVRLELYVKNLRITHHVYSTLRLLHNTSTNNLRHTESKDNTLRKHDTQFNGGWGEGPYCSNLLHRFGGKCHHEENFNGGIYCNPFSFTTQPIFFQYRVFFITEGSPSLKPKWRV